MSRQKGSELDAKSPLRWSILQANLQPDACAVPLANRNAALPSFRRKDGNVTLATLQRAAEILGRKVRLDLV